MLKRSLVVFVVVFALASNLATASAQERRQAQNVDEYCVLVAAHVVACVASSPNADDFNSDSAYKQACARHYRGWTRSLRFFASDVRLPQRIQQAHNNLLKTGDALANAYETEVGLFIDIAGAAMIVAMVDMVAAVDEHRGN